MAYGFRACQAYVRRGVQMESQSAHITGAKSLLFMPNTRNQLKVICWRVNANPMAIRCQASLQQGGSSSQPLQNSQSKP